MLSMSKHPLTSIVLGLVFALGLVMVVGMVVRPWADSNRGPYTKLNLAEEVPPEYDRSPLALILQGNSLESRWQPSDDLPTEDGSTAYVAYGCALCHGLNAQGGAAAGPLAGLDEELIQLFARTGPGGMPAYPEAELPQENLEALSDWLGTLEESESAPQLPHTLEGRSDCLLCHGPGGLKPFPEDHASRTNETCLYCHQS